MLIVKTNIVSTRILFSPVLDYVLFLSIQKIKVKFTGQGTFRQKCTAREIPHTIAGPIQSVLYLSSDLRL